MFEGVLNTILQKALGEFVQDLDSANLKLAVWSGNVSLRNLQLKSEALAKLDLPVFVHAGLIGNLELTVPWKNIWDSPTKIFVENVQLLVAPQDAAAYDETKAKEAERQRKKNMLEAVEEAQRELLRDKKEQKQSWAESIITAIVKNLEIRIEDVHIRYEDPFSKYALGVSLHRIFATTTNAMWKPAVMDSKATGRIFKLAKVENFSMYWNKNDEMLFELSQSEIERKLRNQIVKSDAKSPEHQFIIHPMGCEVKIILDGGTKVIFDVPKAALNIHFTSLITEVRRHQYLNTIALIDYIERGKKKQPFAKWHPNCPITGNAKLWWEYLYKYCEETVVRRRIWSYRWENIKKHRQRCKKYTELRVKQMTGKPSLKELKLMQDLFDLLDVVNITICEQNAKLEAEKVKNSKSWWGNWWGSETKKTDRVTDKFGLTLEEKERVNDAIEQSQAAAAQEFYPEFYEKFKVKVDIDKVSFNLNDNDKVIVEAAVQDISTELAVIPNGNGVNVSSHIQTVYLTYQQTKILRPTDDKDIDPIFQGKVRVNPSESTADIILKSQISSVTLLFDMEMVNAVLDFINTDQEELTNFDQLRANIEFYSKRLKSQGKSGLLYAIEKRKVLDVNVTLSAPKFIVPEAGKIDDNGPLILADLGRLVLTTEVVETRSPEQLLAMSVTELEEVAYDNYRLSLEDFHVKMFPNKDTWLNETGYSHRSYILCPIRLNVSLYNSILPDDKKLPKIKCVGKLNAVECIMSDVKLQNLYKILDSLPKTDAAAYEHANVSYILQEDEFLDVNVLAATTGKIIDTSKPTAEVKPAFLRTLTDVTPTSASSGDEFYDAHDEFMSPSEDEVDGIIFHTLLLAEFSLNRISLDVVKETVFDNTTVLKAIIKDIEAKVVKTSWVQKLEASLGGLSVEHCCSALEEPVKLLSSPDDNKLISISAQMNDEFSPYFNTEYDSTKMSIEGNFDRMIAKMHIDSFLELYEFGMGLIPQSTEEVPAVKDKAKEADTTKKQNTPDTISIKSRDINVVNVSLHATINDITISLLSAKKCYADIQIFKCDAQVTLRALETVVEAKLGGIDVRQPESVGIHSCILSVQSEHGYKELVQFNMTQYNRKENQLDADMRLDVKVASMHFIFLNYFVQNILHVLDTFNKARDKMLSASIETVKTAADRSNSSLIYLSAYVESPVIKIPLNTKSQDAFKVSLGNISLKNDFELTTDGSDIKDILSLHLSNVAISRAVLGPKGRIRITRDILEPLAADICITRYLANSPDILLSTKLKTVSLTLGYEDYHLMLKTLEENLSETGDRVVHAPELSVEETGTSGGGTIPEESKQEVAAPSQQRQENEKKEGGDANASSSSSDSGGKVDVTVTLEDTTCCLFADETKLDPESDATRVRDPSTMIMLSEIRDLKTSISLLPNGDKSIKVTLLDVRIEDTAPAVLEKGIQRILAHKVLANEEAELILNLQGTSPAIAARRAIKPHIPHPMIESELELSSEGDISLSCGVSDVHVVVSWGFINQIMNFFLLSPYDKVAAEGADAAAEERTAIQLSEGVVVAADEENKMPSTKTHVNIKVTNPEFVFLSNHENYKTQGLLLRTGVSLVYRQVADQTSINIEVDQLSMFLCQYLHRLTSVYLLLQPCDLVLTYSKTLGEKEHVDMSISEVVFNINPESLNVILLVANQFSVAQVQEGAVKQHTAYNYNLWNTEAINRDNRWYLRQAYNSAFMEMTDNFASGPHMDYFSAIKPLGQLLILKMNSYRVTMEADYEPLIVITGDLVATVKEWGGGMTVDATVSLESNYYSYTLGTFEPMLEPVEDASGVYRRWTVSCTVTKCPVEVSDEAAQLMTLLGAGSDASSEAAETSSLSSTDSYDMLDNAPPLYDVNISSSDKLLLTLTNSALKNFTVLSEAWLNVKDDMKIEPKSTTPLMIHNVCGVEVLVKGKQQTKGEDPPSIKLAHNEQQNLTAEITGKKRAKDRRKTKALRRGASRTVMEDISDAASINLLIEGYEEVTDIKIVQAGLYIYGLKPLKSKAGGRKEHNILVEVTVIRSSKRITLRSPLSFCNLQKEPVRLWYSAPLDTTNREMVTTIQPGEVYNVPLDAPITGIRDSHHFHVTPDIDNYSPSFPSMSINKLKAGTHFFVSSQPPSTSHDQDNCYSAFSMRALSVRNPNRINLDEATHHKISIYPPLVIINKLPVTLRVQPSGMMLSRDLEPGERAHFREIDPIQDPYLVFRIINYHDMGFDWSGEFQINLNKFEEKNMQNVVMTASNNNVINKVSLTIVGKTNAGLQLSIYSSYWMVNCTGRTLKYQGIHDNSEILDPPSVQQPMMFSFIHTEKGKRRLRVKVDNSDWSEYFSIDTVGSSGSIRCQDADEFFYEIGVTISLSNIGLTNIVTFYPRFQVINELQIPILIKGELSKDYIECKCDKITPFWPGTKDDQCMVIKISKGKPTMAIPLDVTQQTVIRADCSNDNSCGFISIVVFVDVRTATTEIRVGMYYKGAAPVRIENLLSEGNICFKQQDSMHTVTVPKNNSILYTWDYPNKRRDLYWYVDGDGGNQKKGSFIKDSTSTFTYVDLFTQKRKKAQVVSFLDGLQRVLLFTDNPAIAECVGKEVITIEQAHLVVEINFMEPIGVSLVDSVPQEVTYLQADSSGAIWERKLKHRDRYKLLPNKVSVELEEAYMADKTRVEFDGYVGDLSDREYMKLRMPNQSECLVRRTYLSAMWLQYTKSPSQTNLHFKMNRLQIDNQLPDYTFRHVFYPIKPPSHVIAAQPPKPFAEFCCVKQTTAVTEGDKEMSVLDHYKYVKMLIQEFHIKVDAGFLLSLMNFVKIANEEENEEVKDIENIQMDLKLSQTALDDREARGDGGPPVFLDEFHLSPLKMHVSFSPEILIDTSLINVEKDTLALYLSSFGIGVTNISDAVLKLAYYDATGQLVTVSQLQDRVVKHYIHQTLTQLYAVVFGLDIIGNPYSLAQNIKAGTKDLFYEPYQGIVQGPREFAEGVVIGVNSFLRHSVGGLVGAASKITRSVGKGLAKLTFDDNYQKQRNRRMAQKPSHIGEGLARGGKSLLMGMYHGVSGIVLKPKEGAQQEGVEGFFKGVGKGLVGAVTRPLGGISDMITYTIDGIHHHTQVDEKIDYLRHPRYIQPDKILRPYNTTQSEGKYFLQQVSRPRGWRDEYYHHSVLSNKSVFLLTDTKCMLLQYDDMVNEWKVDWHHPYNDVVKLPSLLGADEDAVGITFTVLMDPNAGVSRLFKNRRKKERIVILPSSLAARQLHREFLDRLE